MSNRKTGWQHQIKAKQKPNVDPFIVDKIERYEVIIDNIGNKNPLFNDYTQKNVK